eukprot:m.203969 g.203969  ORF g.203969 m.203969 type:complete len:442 (+) comp15768_c2_seq3:94-1419(+)
MARMLTFWLLSFTLCREGMAFTHDWSNIKSMLAGNFGTFDAVWNNSEAALPRFKWIAENYAIVALNSFGAMENSHEGRWNCTGESGRVQVARILKKYNPNIKLLYYYAASWVTGSACQRAPLDNNKDWQLHDDNGNVVMSAGRPALDPRVPAASIWFQNLALNEIMPRGDKNVAKTLIDGIFVDGSGFRNPSRNISDKLYQSIFNGKMKMLSEAQTMFTQLNNGEVWGNPLIQYEDIGPTVDPSKAQGKNWNLTLQHFKGGFDEMFGSFGTQNSDGSWNITKMAYSMESIINASNAGHTVIIHAFPGPATVPFGPINGTNEHMAIPSWGGATPRPTDLEDVKKASAERLVESLAPFLIVANPTVFFSYAWFYDLNSGYYDCTDFDRLSCTAPDGWYPEFSKPIGEPSGPAVQNGNVWTRSFEHVDVYVDLANRSASKLTWK